jgi:hypothetical protein
VLRNESLPKHNRERVELVASKESCEQILPAKTGVVPARAMWREVWTNWVGPSRASLISFRSKTHLPSLSGLVAQPEAMQFAAFLDMVRSE